MKTNETAELLMLIAMVDNRKYSDEAVQTWHSIIGGYDYEDCKTALVNARQRDDITWLEPKHIVTEVKKLKERRAIDARREQAMAEKGEVELKPAPMCRHAIPIVKCNPCCNEVYRNHAEKHSGQKHGDMACQLFIKSMSVN